MVTPAANSRYGPTPLDDCHIENSSEYDRTIKARGHWELEEALERRLDGCGLLVSVGNRSLVSGRVRVASAEESWREDVDRLIDAASLIICVPGATPGTAWEIESLAQRGHLGKTIFVSPGNSLIYGRKPRLFRGHTFFARKLRERSSYVPPHFEYWSRVGAQYVQYGFPAFEPYGEAFMIASAEGEALETFAAVDRQVWATRPVLDLLLLALRHELVHPSRALARKLRRYQRVRREPVPLVEHQHPFQWQPSENNEAAPAVVTAAPATSEEERAATARRVEALRAGYDTDLRLRDWIAAAREASEELRDPSIAASAEYLGQDLVVDFHSAPTPSYYLSEEDRLHDLVEQAQNRVRESREVRVTAEVEPLYRDRITRSTGIVRWWWRYRMREEIDRRLRALPGLTFVYRNYQ